MSSLGGIREERAGHARPGVRLSWWVEFCINTISSTRWSVNVCETERQRWKGIGKAGQLRFQNLSFKQIKNYTYINSAVLCMFFSILVVPSLVALGRCHTTTPIPFLLIRPGKKSRQSSIFHSLAAYLDETGIRMCFLFKFVYFAFATGLGPCENDC